MRDEDFSVFVELPGQSAIDRAPGTIRGTIDGNI
jgi:hypothetical protein